MTLICRCHFWDAFILKIDTESSSQDGRYWSHLCLAPPRATVLARPLGSLPIFPCGLNTQDTFTPLLILIDTQPTRHSVSFLTCSALAPGICHQSFIDSTKWRTTKAVWFLDTSVESGMSRKESSSNMRPWDSRCSELPVGHTGQSHPALKFGNLFHGRRLAPVKQSVRSGRRYK